MDDIARDFSDHKPLLSVIIPARNEARHLPSTIEGIVKALQAGSVRFELVVVDDHSQDDTGKAVKEMMEAYGVIRLVSNDYPPGYGSAVRKGLAVYKGDAAVIVMADASDDPKDIVKYYRKLEEGYECVFGTRFCRQAKVRRYPLHKLLLNRLGNLLIASLFMISYKDITNAFKCYRRDVIDGIQPLVSSGFNLTVEMPLKAIIKGYRWTVLPTHWRGRKQGLSKWKIKELGSGYLGLILSLWRQKIRASRDHF